MGLSPRHRFRPGDGRVGEVVPFLHRQGVQPEDKRALESDQVVCHFNDIRMIADPVERNTAWRELDTGQERRLKPVVGLHLNRETRRGFDLVQKCVADSAQDHWMA